MADSLQVLIRSAEGLPDVERFGKNDPYAKITLNLTDKDYSKQTTAKNNAGKNVEWNEEFTLADFNPTRDQYLYVDVIDKEVTVDQPIGFAAIPLQQVLEAPEHVLKGRFDLHESESKVKGTVSLTIAYLRGGQQPHNLLGSQAPEVKGRSTVETEHLKKFKSAKNLERASDAATLLAGVAAVAGAKYIHDAQKKAQHEA
ncbi:hypothetical protein BGZ46_007431 [Entomortierella lignicola]|nr:hypothetical protein BGZ46_007431 [Entomortierella lignicola]